MTDSKSLSEQVSDQIKKLQDDCESRSFAIPALSKEDLDALSTIDTNWYNNSQYSNNINANSYPGVTTVTLTSGGGGGGGGTLGSGTTYISSGTGYPNPPIVNSGIGTTGTYYTSGPQGPTWTGVTTPATVKISGKNPKIQTDKSEIDLDETAELIKIVKERLLILIPNFEKHEKYQALKKAYENYKMIEALIQEEKIDVK